MKVLAKILMILSVVFLVANLAGCKNACEKAADTVLSCINDFCADNSDNSRCDEETLGNFETAMMGEAAECPEEMAAEEPSDDCDEILYSMGFTPPPEADDEEEEEETE